MSKLYRSLLWSGLVAAGVAACGDNVVVPPPAPPPTPTVHSVSVAPTGVTIPHPSTLQMTASINADAGVATTVAWSAAPTTVATINPTTGVLTTVAAGVVAVQACATANTAVCGNATLTVSTAPLATVTSVLVSPANPTIVRTTPANTLQLTAAVVGTNAPSQTVTWQASPAPLIATVSATGLVTVPTSSPGGTVVITACSTVTGFTNVCGSSSVNVAIPTPATVSIEAVTYVPAPGAPVNCAPGPGPAVPVVLTNVNCQIEVTANVNAGDVVLSRIDVLIGGQVVASQTFPGTVASDGENASVSAPVIIVMSVNTRQVKSGTTSGGSCNGFVCIPVIYNGNQQITLNLYTAQSATPLASNAIPVVMNNADAVIYPKTLVSTILTPTFTVGGVTFFTGSQTIGGGEYIAFSKQAPLTSSFTGTLCGASTTGVTGTFATGIALGGVFTCLGVQGANTVSTAAPPVFTYAAVTGPDGTPITPPLFWSTIGTGFTVPINAAGTTELRWNLLLQNGAPVPLPVALAAVFVDNKAPVATVGIVAFNDLFDFPWVNAAYLFAQDLAATDVGGSGVALLEAHDFVGVICTATVKTSPGALTPDGYPETLVSNGSPDGFRICAFARDNIGNTASSGPSNFFGVDKTTPLARLIFANPPGVNPVGIFTSPNVSATQNISKYQTAAALANMPWGLEGIDTRSGFNQTVVVGADDAAHQALLRLWPGAVASIGDPACTLSDQMVTLLSDGWKRTGIPGSPTLDCGAGVGYYFYNGYTIDRAGNQTLPSTPGFPATSGFVRNFVFDPGAPNMTGIGFASAFYTPGTAAPFSFSANDDLNLVSATLGFSMSGMPFPSVGVQYPQCCLSLPPGPSFGITLGAGWGVLWPTTKAQLVNILNGAVANVDNLLFRTDESCRFNGDPYTSCDVATNGTGARPTLAANYNQNLYGPPGPVVLTDQQKLPTAVLANVADAVGRESATGIVGQMLNTQFSPSTGIPAPWGGAGCSPLSSTCADIANWTGAIVGINAVATHKTQSSNGVTYFDDVSLWRFNTTVNQWNFCERATPPLGPTIDNGTFRTWTYTVLLPTGPSPCFQLTGQFKFMGRKGGAGLFTVAFP